MTQEASALTNATIPTDTKHHTVAWVVSLTINTNSAQFSKYKLDEKRTLTRVHTVPVQYHLKLQWHGLNESIAEPHPYYSTYC